MSHNRIDTLVVSPLDEEEINAAKKVYVGIDEQPPTYDESGVPDYARMVAHVVTSMKPKSVLEFGCNAGRNLDLMRQNHKDCVYRGVDINPLNIERGRARFDLDLIASDEAWLRQQPAESHDVSFTISVIDHMPYPEEVLRQLLRITKDYLVLFELAHDRIGRATHNLYHNDTTATIKPVYRYSYIHDYRYECERKFGALCIADLRVPIGKEYLWDLYRLYVFTKRRELYANPLIAELAMKPIVGRS